MSEKLRKHAESQRVYRKKKEVDPTYKESENKRVEQLRKKRVSKMGAKELNNYKRAAAERQRKSRERRNAQATNKSTPKVDYNNQYHTPQAYGKAVRKVVRCLPSSPRKKKAVVIGLAKRVGIDLTDAMDRSLSESSTISANTQVVKDFYVRPDISYHCPGLKDEITIWDKEGKKHRMRKYYLTLFLREAYAVFTTCHPNNIVGFSTFCELRPPNVLLMKHTPKDQCRCKVHDNFMLMLKGLQITYDNNWWKSILCTDDINSKCWTGECNNCKDGNNLQVQLSKEKPVIWKQWEKVESGNLLRVMTHQGTCGELIGKIQSQFSAFRKHVYIKRIQAAQFQLDKDSSEERVLQIDFAMAFSCEYQAEIQSALWSRNSVNLFTAAAFSKEGCDTYLICSDCHTKDKDAIAAFLLSLYDNLCKSKQFKKEIIWSDGPSSEFKNQFMAKLLNYFSQRYQKEFEWRYTATSHGKDIVDGVGGLAKSLVLRKIMASHGELIVQSSTDFHKVASEVMEKTTVIHISTTEVKEITSELDLWNSSVPIPGIRDVHRMTACYKKCTVNCFHTCESRQPSFTADYHLEQDMDTDDNYSLPPSPELTVNHSKPEHPEEGSWLAVLFDEAWWPGQVISVLPSEGKVQVKFTFKPVGVNKFQTLEKVQFENIPIHSYLLKLPGDPAPIDHSARFFSYDKNTAKAVKTVMQNC